jgi:hypothetical protein
VSRTRISSKHQITIGRRAFDEAGFREGDVLAVRAVGPGRVELTRLDARFARHRGRVKGRQRGAAGGRVRELVEDFGIRILPVDAEIAEKAAGLQAAYRATSTREPRPKLRIPDALILATAAVYDDVDTVIGGAEQWSKVPQVDAEIVILRS